MTSLDQWSRSELACWATVATMLAAALLIAGAHLVDKRLLDGVGVWAKPLKFALATALHFATMGLVLGALSPAWREGPLLTLVVLAGALCALVEVGYIALQGGRGEQSHFNTATPIAAMLFSLMAIGAVMLTAAAGAVGAAALADAGARLGPATRLGVGIGLIGGTILTIIVGLTMGGAGSHFVGSEPPGAARMPLTGWSLTVGDWRVSHFFATHMMQAVPLAGLLLDGLVARWLAVGLVGLIGAGWAVLTWYFFQLGGQGLPFLR